MKTGSSKLCSENQFVEFWHEIKQCFVFESRYLEMFTVSIIT